MMMSGPEHDGDPTKVGFPVIDVAVGMLGALSIASALYRQEKDGVGQHIETSLVQASLMLMYPYTTDYLTDKKTHKRLGNKGYSGSPASDAFRCRDGWISTAANTPTQFKKMMNVLGLESICSDPNALDLDSFNAVNEGFVVAKDPSLVKEKIQSVLLTKSAFQMEIELNSVGVPAAKVRTLSEFLEEASSGVNINIPLHEIKNNNKLIKTSGLGFILEEHTQKQEIKAPKLGEHTAEILQKIGLTNEQIEGIIKAGILK